jgi:hypothetical protein
MKNYLAALAFVFACSIGLFAQTPADFDGKRGQASVAAALEAAAVTPAPAAPVEHPSHSDMDWRDDKAAYKSVEPDATVYPRLPRSGAAITISAAEFKEKLEELTGVREVTIAGNKVRIPQRGGAQGLDLARAWLAQEYQKIGFQTSTHQFRRGVNFIAKKPGTSGKTLIISAHLDSVNNAGADDDGSGIIASLLIATALKNAGNVHTLQILGFDAEEKGLLGSDAYSKTVDKKEILGVMQMDMISYNSKRDGRFHVIDCDRADSKFLTAALMGNVQSLGLPLTRNKACTERSDHASFWRMGIPAIAVSENFFGGDGNSCYHQPCDVIDERLNFDYAAAIATALANSAAALISPAPAL